MSKAPRPPITLTTLADAIRNVTIKVEEAVASGHRDRKIDVDDVIEILLSIADEIDPD